MPDIHFTDQWGLAKPDKGAVGYDDEKNADADSIDKKLGGGTFENNSGSTIETNKAVRQTEDSASDNDIDLADAGDAATMPAIGFTIAEIANGADGYVQNRGVLSGFTGLTAGAVYYMDSTSAEGEITSTRPTPSDLVQVMGIARSATELEVMIQPTGLDLVPAGILLLGVPLDGTLRDVKDSADTVSILKLATQNVGINEASFGSSAVGVLVMGTGTAPGSSPANAFQMYSADQAAGNACAHFRTELGTVIKLYQQAHIADVVESSDPDQTITDLVAAVNGIYQVLENAGFLATS